MIRIGVICPSEIAARRFMPALSKDENFKFIGVGVNSIEERFGKDLPTNDVVESVMKAQTDKAEKMVELFGGRIFDSYEAIATSKEIDALYIPLPPALHFKWAKIALEHGKHVLVEKPSTISVVETKQLIEIAKAKGVALHENYMFAFHDQLTSVNEIVESGLIGEVRLYRISFGFPKRENNDFRYNKNLGGGALIDAGGYCIKYASILLGASTQIKYAQLNYLDFSEVDIYGSGALVNKNGLTTQIAFGMDNGYKCDLEVWGSQGSLTTGRILTAPANFEPELTIHKGTTKEIIKLPADDAFAKSIGYFYKCIHDSETRLASYENILKQSELVDQFKSLAGEKR